MSHGSNALGVRAALTERPGYWGRMRCYLREMYPAVTYISFATLIYLDLSWLARRADFVSAAPHRWMSAVGIGNIYVIGLLTRLLDELKDEAIDRRLFPHRPLPSGKILVSDVKVTVIGLIAIYVCMNIAVGPVGWLAGAILGYTLLTYRHFFMRGALEGSLTLTLLTHSPLLALVLLYVAALGLEEGASVRAPLDAPALLLSVSMFWTMIEGVEIARKIRAPEQETEYDTYSKVWGAAGAVLVAAALQTWALVAALYLSWRLSLPIFFPAVVLIAYGMLCWGYRGFLAAPAPETSRLKPFAEAYALLILLALAAAQGLRP